MSTGTIESRSPQDQSDVVVSAPAADREDVAAAFKRAREAAKEWSRSALARADALSAAGWRDEPENVGYAVFGVRATRETELREGDRLELLRPLVADPKDARRRRAESTKTKPRP